MSDGTMAIEYDEAVIEARQRKAHRARLVEFLTYLRDAKEPYMLSAGMLDALIDELRA